jgi:cysteine desulfuration protein SufE
MRLAAHRQSLIDELMHLDDSQERLAAVVERTRRQPHFSPVERSAQHRVPGCSSNVWLISELRDGRCFFRTDADSPVVRGLVFLLADYFSCAKPAEIIGDNTDPLEVVNLRRSLSSTRQHGLDAVRAAIKAFAQAQLTAPTGST